TPAPKIIPHTGGRWGSPPHAIAMTTVLSPDSRMLIHMICSRATQKVAWPISLQPLVTMPSQVAGSIICESEPTGCAFSSTRADLLDGPPQAGVIYKPKPTPGPPPKPPPPPPPLT